MLNLVSGISSIWVINIREYLSKEIPFHGISLKGGKVELLRFKIDPNIFTVLVGDMYCWLQNC